VGMLRVRRSEATIWETREEREDAPRRAKDLRFSVSSYMAGSSERMSPFGSWWFQHEQWGQ